MKIDKFDKLFLNKRVFKLEKNGRSLFSQIVRCFLKIKIFHPVAFRMLYSHENGMIFSLNIRELLKKYYNVHVGMYSYIACLKLNELPAGTRIGNYCSIAAGLKIFRRNHPIDRLSQHALFFNRNVGFLMRDTIDKIEDNPLTIGNDVWIGENVIITPNCKKIGNGAVIAAGAVVTRDVPVYTVVGGVPAKFIRLRFENDIQQCIEQSQWWLRPLSDLIDLLPLFEQPISIKTAQKIEEALR